MTPADFYRHWMRGTKILRPPKHLLATFGTTTIKYVLLSDLPNVSNQCRLREGRVTAEKPRILTPELWKKRFEGFGDDAEAYKDLFDRAYGEAFRGLEYTFKNELDQTSIESAPLQEVADRAIQVMNSEDAPRTTVLQAPDAMWALSVMKFIVDLSMRSFSGNVRELDDRGLFEPEKRAAEAQRREIERLFKEAQTNPAMIRNLGEHLNKAGIFSEYEDRFFALVNASKPNF